MGEFEKFYLKVKSDQYHFAGIQEATRDKKKSRDLIPGSADPAHTNACIVSDPFTSGCSVVWNYAFIGMP